ncbi:carbohydrate ABC transporter permease [Spirochaeta cellobiosiphila]|uniref:carbohydrate ABC transporter permease n=1 Tax=Spirochaeta cellobiosiphila TaxID=504483 RepID=UPI00041B71AE|nr:carbohydrate ABC transporter permease [Spirochaeta cellobiosiphila]
MIKRKTLGNAVLSVFSWIIGLLWFSPILWMLSTSLKPTKEAIQEVKPHWIPEHITFENYSYLFASISGISVTKGILNSFLVGLLTILLTIAVCIPAAYALSRLKFKGQRTIFLLYICVLAFPPILFLVPNYFIVHTLGLMDSFAALIFPAVGGTFGVFLLRQYMVGIAKDLEDAAWIDGCSKFRFMISIVTPFVKPALVVLSLMTFINSWNNFLWPLLVLNSPQKLTLPITLVRFTAGWGDPYRGIGVLMAGAFISTIPTLILFLGFYKYLLEGVTVGTVSK